MCVCLDICSPEQVQYFGFDHRAAFHLLQNALQRFSQGIAILLPVCMPEVAVQQSVLPPGGCISGCISNTERRTKQMH